MVMDDKQKQQAIELYKKYCRSRTVTSKYDKVEYNSDINERDKNKMRNLYDTADENDRKDTELGKCLSFFEHCIK